MGFPDSALFCCEGKAVAPVSDSAGSTSGGWMRFALPKSPQPVIAENNAIRIGTPYDGRRPSGGIAGLFKSKTYPELVGDKRADLCPNSGKNQYTTLL